MEKVQKMVPKENTIVKENLTGKAKTIGKAKSIVVKVLVILAIIIFCYWQNNYLSESYYTFSSSKVDSALNGLKIAQISDLHNKRFGKEQKRLLDKLKAYAPDIIVVTGDVVDSNRTDIDIAIEFMEGAVEIAPVYYITGNHEIWLESTEMSELLDRMTGAGVRHLDDECIELTHNGAEFNLIGLDDASLIDNTLDKLMKEVDTSQFTLLLAHEPQYLGKYSAYEIDLVLSGHAHGGQIRLPFIGGLVAPDQGFFPEYTAGVYEKNGTTMIVSRGLGNSVVPLRIFNYPEIVYIEIQKE